MVPKCKGCGNAVTGDGHGEAIHVIAGVVTSYAYGCEPKSKGKEYPVAR